MSEDFVVNDKRIFTSDGEIRSDDNSQHHDPAQKEDGHPNDTFSEQHIAPPPASFTGLLIGLATSVLMNLGESIEPGQPPAEANLPAAKHTIDLLAVLQDKTRGNLAEEEDALLKTLLYDLRLKFVKASGQ